LSAREINRFGQQSSTTAEKNKETTKAKGASSKAKISGSRKDENFGRELDLKTQQYPAEIELMKEQISLLQERYFFLVFWGFKIGVLIDP
jgi:hypothetical protein